MLGAPFPQSYWVHPGLLCAGQYPGALKPADRDAKLQSLLSYGIRRIVSLMEAEETSPQGAPFDPYVERIQGMAASQGSSVECLRFPIRDATAANRATMVSILNAIDDSQQREIPTYLHCWGGHGRTSMVVACHLIRRGATPQQALAEIAQFRQSLPKNHYPFEGNQEQLIRTWQPRE